MTNYGALSSWRAPTRLWRQGHRDQPHAAHQARRPLHRRLGSVHEDLHLSAVLTDGQRWSENITASLPARRLRRPPSRPSSASALWRRNIPYATAAERDLAALPLAGLRSAANALVTGAGRGIGLGAASARRAGAEVVLAARSGPDRGRRRRGAGGKASALVLDVEDRGATAAAIAEHVRRHPRQQCRNQPPTPLWKSPKPTRRPAQRRRSSWQAVVKGFLPPAGPARSSTSPRRWPCRRGQPHRLLRVEARGRGFHQGDGRRAQADRYCVNSISPTFIETPMTAPIFRSRFRPRCSARRSVGSAGSRM